jgi:predicted O-methyltransferase YrrM
MAPLFERLHRLLFCRGGYGIHSPFAFDLITTVIEEKRAYYCYEALDRIRLQLQRENRKIRCGNKELSMKKAMRTCCFSVEGYRLLFRLANRFHPEKVLVIGSGMGLTPLYVSACSKKTDCVVFEPDPPVAVVARNVVRKYARSSIKIYDRIFDGFDAPEPEPFDFIVWGKGVDFPFHAFENMLRYVTGRSVMVVCGINRSAADRQVWSRVCTHPEVSVTFDLYSLGIIFFNSKLHRKTYKGIPV